MPFKSKDQQAYMFTNLPKIAKRWAKETPNFKSLPENVKKKKAILKKHTGKGGMETSPFKQVASPIDLLTTNGEPPTTKGVPKTKDNY
jgi:hypothetical protein